MKIIILSLIFFFSTPSFADYTEKYKGVAYNKKNEIIYIENHQVTFSDDTNVKEAVTTYLNTKGKKIAEISSDFKKSLSAPVYTFKDFRHKSGHGIAYVDNKLQLIKYKKNGRKKTKFITKKFSPDSLIVGGQGMHYYLRQNFNSLKNKKNVPVKFLTPGNLDYYNFKLNYTGINKEGYITLEIKISNLILRIFAPSLYLQYDPKTKRLIQYEGLSNLADDNDDIQSVKIKYKY